MASRIALITGIFGQDGSYLAELLSRNGYHVHGLIRESLSPTSTAIRHALACKGIVPTVHVCDLNSYEDVRSLLEGLQPDECYHVAATHFSSQDSSAKRQNGEARLFQDNALGVLNILEAVRACSPRTRTVCAGSCLMFDGVALTPQNEETPYHARSIYGASKIVGARVVESYRGCHGLHASVAILYNHESPRRAPTFMSKKVVQGVVGVARNETQYFTLGNLHAVKDWGYAKDYARGMWLMAQHETPGDYVLATGEGHTVEDFVQCAARSAGLSQWSRYVRLQEGLTEQPIQTPLVGNPALARARLGWKPSISFHELVELMVENERRGKLD